ncbi:MAG: hypothetical protein WDO74_30635 [Pseudomonadota bacterium]
MEEDEDETPEGSSGGLNPELVKSYLSFARRALRKNRLLGIALFLVCAGLTFAASVYLPRTFVCKTVIMAQVATVLDRNNAPNALDGAESLIMRQENLEAMVRDTGLVRNFELRRPPLLKVKDQVMAALFGPMSDKIKMASLVGSLQTKIEPLTEKNLLSITVSWSDGQTAAEIADAARESFLKSRHTVEISAFEDKMAILDGHASALRDDVATLANQMETEGRGGASSTDSATPTDKAPRARVPRYLPRAAATPDPLVAGQLGLLKEKLAAAKPKLAELEGDWQRRLREAQGKMEDLRLRLTPNHPEVLTQQERLSLLSQVPSDIAVLRAEIATLQADVKAGDLIGSRGGVASGGAIAAANVGSLPTEVIQALAKEDADPALRAQLSGAIVKYGDLRTEILSSKIDLDTAQAAFNHRYQIVMPAEVPSKATKPKPAVVIGAGLFLSLLLGLLIPIVTELRRGVIVETWQVHQLELPVLAELRLPPHSE